MRRMAEEGPWIGGHHFLFPMDTGGETYSPSLIPNERLSGMWDFHFPERERLCFFDVETTGVPKDYSADARDLNNWPRIVQIAWILTDLDGREIEKHCTTIRPEGFEIPRESTAVHGIEHDKALLEGVELRFVLEHFYLSWIRQYPCGA